MTKFLISLDKTVYSDSEAAEQAITQAGATILKSFSFPLTYEIEATSEQAESIEGIAEITEKDSPVNVTLQLINRDHLNYTVRKSLNDNSLYVPANTGTGQHIYLVDTGIAANHEQFEFANINQLHSNFDSDFSDGSGHGTAIASVIVGKDLGASPDATLHVVKLFHSSGAQMPVGEIVDALDAILSHHNSHNATHVKTVCLPWTASQNNFIDAKIIEMHNSNLVVVAAAGNNGVDVNTLSPAGVDIILTVGAFDRNYAVAGFTNVPWNNQADAVVYNNYGAQLDIFALGVDVSVAAHTNTGGYNTVSGTSVSAGVVAGIAAHYVERLPTHSSREIKDVILQTGNLLGNKLLKFDSAADDIDYSTVYRAIALTDRENEIQLTAWPSGRIADVKQGETVSIDLGIAADAVDVKLMSFAPPAPFITVDIASGIVSVDTAAMDSEAAVPGIFLFAVRGTIDGVILVQEFSVGVYENSKDELELALQYYYDDENDSYDQANADAVLTSGTYGNKL
jgi:subtilisin family serine protease